MGEAPARHSILRKDDTSPHRPGNSIYVPTRMSRTNAVLVEYQGKIHLLKDVASIEAIDYNRLLHWVSREIPLSEAIDIVKRNPRTKPLIGVTYNGELMSLMGFANLRKVNYNRLLRRVRLLGQDPLLAANELLKEGDKPPKSQKLDAPRKKPRITPSES